MNSEFCKGANLLERGLPPFRTFSSSICASPGAPSCSQYRIRLLSFLAIPM